MSEGTDRSAGTVPPTPVGTCGGWSILRSPGAALALAASGVDWICLDAQHGEHDDASVRELCRLLSGRVQVLVRPPANDVAWIGRALDLGADGVIVPMVNSADEAARAVAACRYPPAGGRSWGPLLGGYTDPGATPAAICSVMVETGDALVAVDELVATPGVDEIFVGPFDLALALGTTVDKLLAAEGPADPLPRIIAAAHRKNLPVRVFGASVERSRALLALGFDAVAVVTDVAALTSGAASWVSATLEGRTPVQ